MRVLASALLCVPLLAFPALAQTVPSGEQLFRSQCGACHGVDSRNRVGPGLAGGVAASSQPAGHQCRPPM